MVPIYLCDDDPQIRAAIRRELEKEILINGYDMKVAAACAGPEELLEALGKIGQRGIYFLDVDLMWNIGLYSSSRNCSISSNDTSILFFWLHSMSFDLKLTSLRDILSRSI